MVTSQVLVLPFNWAPEHYLGWRLIRYQERVCEFERLVYLDVYLLYIMTICCFSRFYIHTFLTKTVSKELLKTLDPLRGLSSIYWSFLTHPLSFCLAQSGDFCSPEVQPSAHRPGGSSFHGGFRPKFVSLPMTSLANFDEGNPRRWGIFFRGWWGELSGTWISQEVSKRLVIN